MSGYSRCPACEGQPMSPDCAICGGSGTTEPGTPHTAAGRDAMRWLQTRAWLENILAIEAEARAARDAEIRALREALHDQMATVAFLRSVVASGERLNADDETLMRKRYEMARAILDADTPS